MAENGDGRYTSVRVTALEDALGKLDKKRRSACADLGESLYDVTKSVYSLKDGREELYDRIAEIDKKKATVEYQLRVAKHAEDESRARAAAAAAAMKHVYICPRCGSEVPADDLFCTGCGMPVAEIKKALGVRDGSGAGGAGSPVGYCSHCGAPLEEGDVFCTNCGRKVEQAPEPSTPAPAAPTVPEAMPEPEPTRQPGPALGSQLPELPAVEPLVETETIVLQPDQDDARQRQAKPAAEQKPQQSYRFCPSCGAKVEPNYKFCLRCGARLQ